MEYVFLDIVSLDPPHHSSLDSNIFSPEKSSPTIIFRFSSIPSPTVLSSSCNSSLSKLNPYFFSHVYSLPSCSPQILQCKLLVRYAVGFLSCSQLYAQGTKQYLEPSRCVINIGCMNECKHVFCASASFLSHVTDKDTEAQHHDTRVQTSI